MLWINDGMLLSESLYVPLVALAMRRVAAQKPAVVRISRISIMPLLPLTRAATESAL